MDPARRLRALANRARRVPRRAQAGDSRCSCVSAVSTSTPTTTRSPSSTTSSARLSASSPATEATCSSSRSATRAPTCTPSSARRSHTRTMPARAAAAALDLRRARAVDRSLRLQIGITTGRLRSGTYGHTMRRTFVCLGDAVNLAARLMSKAPPGGVYVTEAVREQAGDSFAWQRLPDLEVSGKSNAVAAYSLIGLTGLGSRRRTHDQLAARRAWPGARRTRRGPPGLAPGGRLVVGVAAEAGLGKSRLVAEFVRSVRERRIARSPSAPARRSARTRATTSGRRSGAACGASTTSSRRRTSTAASARISRPSIRRSCSALPLLGPVLGLTSRTTLSRGRSTPSSARRRSRGCSRSACSARAGEEPLVLVLEDCHWIDPLSRDLLEVLAALPLSSCRCSSCSTTARASSRALEQLPQFRRSS